MAERRGVARDDGGAAVFGAAILHDVGEPRIILIEHAAERALEEFFLAVAGRDERDV